MIRGLGRTSYFPTGDRRVLEAASRVYEQTLTPDDMERLAKPYGEWRGYWAHYLRVAG